MDCSPTPLSMGFSGQEYWSALPFPSPGDLPEPGTEPGSPASQADSLPSEPPGKPIGMHCAWRTGRRILPGVRGRVRVSSFKGLNNLDVSRIRRLSPVPTLRETSVLQSRASRAAPRPFPLLPDSCTRRN